MNFQHPFLLQSSITQILLMRYVPFQSHSCHCSLMKHKLLFFPNHWFHIVSCFLIVWWDSLYFRCSFPAFSKHAVVYCFPYPIRKVLMLYTLSVSNSYDYLIIWAFLSIIIIFLSLFGVVWHSRQLATWEIDSATVVQFTTFGNIPFLALHLDFLNGMLSI